MADEYEVWRDKKGRGTKIVVDPRPEQTAAQLSLLQG
jgi:hypothetical protein